MKNELPEKWKEFKVNGTTEMYDDNGNYCVGTIADHVKRLIKQQNALVDYCAELRDKYQYMKDQYFVLREQYGADGPKSTEDEPQFGEVGHVFKPVLKFTEDEPPTTVMDTLDNPCIRCADFNTPMDHDPCLSCAPKHKNFTLEKETGAEHSRRLDKECMDHRGPFAECMDKYE